MTPRRVWRRSGEMLVEEIVWYRDEWCRRVPREWLDACGCRRCCDNVPAEWARVVEENGFMQIMGNGYVWFVRRDNATGRYCLYPWPRRLYGWVLGSG